MARLIRDVMNNAFDNPIDAQDIPKRYAIQSVHGKAVCNRCKGCKKSWSSNLAWLTFDLRNQRIARAWLQKCKGCEAENRLWFHPDELENMVIHAVERCIKLKAGKYSKKKRKDDYGRPPHEERLCERCGYGNRRCWASGN